MRNNIKKYITAIILENHFLVNKKRTIREDEIPKICCDENELEFLYNCSNLIIRINRNDEWNGYFRVCDLNEKLKYKIFRHIDLYFNTIVKDQVLEYEIILSSLKKKKNWRRFIGMGSYSDPSSRARKFYLTKNCSVVGIDAPSKNEIGDERWRTLILNIDHFLKYMMNLIRSNKDNVGSGRYETYSSNRALATEIVARHLGLSNMIPKSQMVILEYKEEKILGLFMEKAAGIASDDITDSEAKLMLSPSLQKALVDLNALDLICFERDHRPGNYNLLIKDGKAIGVVSFDNDSPRTFAPLPSFFHQGSGCSPLIRRGMVNRPYFSKETASTLFSLDMKLLTRELSPYLTKIQLLFVRIRVNQLKKAVLRTLNNKNDFLISNDQWSVETINEELNGCYGLTYLSKFIHFRDLMREFEEYNTCAPI